jgi:type IX secretion system PorP/SprF family membrane protein
MRILYTYILIILFIFLINKKGYTQDIHFSQISEVPIIRNPALAGIFTGDLRIQAVYRNQWSSVSVPYQTMALDGEYKFPVGSGNDYMTIGAILFHDKAGSAALATTRAEPVLNFHKSLSSDRNMYLSAGFSAGIVQKSVDRSKMITDAQWGGSGYDPSIDNGETFSNGTFMYFDGSVGLTFNAQVGDNEDDNFYIGAAYHHFNQSARISFYNAPDIKKIPKIVLSAGVKLNVNESAFMTFYGDFSSQGMEQNLVSGLLYSLKLDDDTNPNYIISLGGLIRWEDAIIPMVKMEVMPITIGVSYDVNVSPLKAVSQSRGGFELTLTYQKFLDRSNARDALRCPRF